MPRVTLEGPPPRMPPTPPECADSMLTTTLWIGTYKAPALQYLCTFTRRSSCLCKWLTYSIGWSVRTCGCMELYNPLPPGFPKRAKCSWQSREGIVPALSWMQGLHLFLVLLLLLCRHLTKFSPHVQMETGGIAWLRQLVTEEPFHL